MMMKENPHPTKKNKKKDDSKFDHFELIVRRKEQHATIDESKHGESGEVVLVNDEYYQSIEPHVIHLENRLLYFDSLCVASQFPPLLNMKLFPNGKEITESLSAYYSIRDYFEFKNQLKILSNRNVVCYVIGDGNVPRTASVFACATNWRVFSIDPRMKQKWICKFNENSSNNKEGQPEEEERGSTSVGGTVDFVEGLEATPSIQRLYPFSMTSSEFLQTQLFRKVVKSCTTELSVIVAVHSHANLWEFYREIPSPKLCLEIPCCFKPNIQREPITVFTDKALHSEKNTIYMWYDK